MGILLKNREKMTYDAIVVGSGASGGWAAKEFCDKGLSTLILERGRDVQHIKDYPTASKGDWEFKFRTTIPLKQRIGVQDVNRYNDTTLHWSITDDEQPIILEKPFRWFRGYHTGGKSLLWARATQRWSDLDFEGPARDGFAVDWPIRYKDIAPWYSYVEKFAGIAGDRDGLEELPDSEVLPAFELNCVELHVKESIKKHYGDSRHLIAGRCAHITEPKDIHLKQGRVKCQNQTMCNRGCVFGGYFSSNSSTLPWAMKTGNLTLRPHSVVHSVIYDEDAKKAIGVRVIDSLTLEMVEFYAKVIFLNASTINSNAILLNSTSNRFPNGLGNDNGLMGKFLTSHNYRGKGSGVFEGFLDRKDSGRSPSNGYIPRFRNLHKQETDFLRGYSIGIKASRNLRSDIDGIGSELTNNLLNPEYGPWTIGTWMQGETVPIEENHLRIHPELKDKYGIPLIIFSCDWTDNDEKMLKDFMEQNNEMLEKAGFINVSARDTKNPMGSDVHEMGGVRMGHDPKTSLLNKWNQLHHCSNVFVTDGACMTSNGTQNPTLTFMALTARAANYAIDSLKKNEL